jgi:hypothetical protein
MMEDKKMPFQIVITSDKENEKQKLPVNLLLTLAAGAISGVLAILGLIWGIELLF